jgi:hypothetical protein
MTLNFQRFSNVARTVLAAASLTVAACSDSTTAPDSRMIPTERAAAAVRTTGNSNSTKYSDRGAKPATGRSGSASIMSRVLLAADGTSRIEITTGDFDVPGSAAGDVVQVLLKIYDRDGKLIDTDIRNGLSGSTVSLARSGLGRGYRVVVQANVRGIDPRRTDVVTTDNTVRMRPDPSVQRVDVPDQVRVGEAAPITAVVKELNGEVGARADCVLYADGAAVDRSPRIWVDAGDAVTCAFSHRFTTLGAHQVRVALENVSPTDFNLANNSAGASLTVVPVTFQMGYSAEAFQHTGTYQSNYTYRYTEPGYSTDFQLDYAEKMAWQFSRIYAWVDQPLEFPVTKLELSQTTNGQSIDARNFSSLGAGAPFGTATDGGVCADLGNAGNAVVLCTYHNNGAKWTSIYYDRSAGVVTYSSYQRSTYTAAWGSGMYGTPSWSFNGNTWGPGVTLFGSSVSISVRVASGVNVFAADATIPLTTTPYREASQPCSTTAQGPGTVTQCYDIVGSYVDLSGAVSR